MKEKLLTVTEAARKLKVEPVQILEWIRDGTLGVIFPSFEGYQIREGECVTLFKFIEKQKIREQGLLEPS